MDNPFEQVLKLIREQARNKADVGNGRSPVGWLIDRYKVTTDEPSGIRNDPNDWGREHGTPRYVLDLLLSVITVAVKTTEIVAALPEVDWEKE